MIIDKRSTKHKGEFEKMNKTELRKVLDGYHAVMNYGPQFQDACEVYNRKFRDNACVFINGEPVKI